MNAEETARKYYESARQELIQRIQLRDNVVLAFLVAIATIFGISLGTSTRSEILLIVPYLALGATVLVVQHHAVIGAIGDFLCRELEPFFIKMGHDAPQWDSSQAIKSY